MPGYMYAQKDNNLYVNLFATSSTMIEVNKKTIELTQQNNYPWDGDLMFNVTPKSARGAERIDPNSRLGAE